MRPVLIADIGATNCRFAVVGEDGRPRQMSKLRGDVVASLQDAIALYIDEAKVRPRAAVLAIAAPVAGDAISMTNRAWNFRLTELAARFGWTAARAMNDFEAVARGVTRLAPDDVRALGPTMLPASGPRVVFGPGTGLGVAALIPNGPSWRVVPTEGGHVSFGPASDAEEKIFANMRAECGAVSAERVLSGPGLERLHRAIHGAQASKSAAEIVAAAHADDDDARETALTFVRLFGRFAGDLALMFRANGGVYAAGGVSRRLGAFLDSPDFRTAFENHPPYESMMRGIATTLITYDEPGLLGCAAMAEELAAAA